MAYVILTEQRLSDIAAAIREKNGTNNTYLPSEMPAAIRALYSGTIGGDSSLEKHVARDPTAVTTLDLGSNATAIGDYAFFNNTIILVLIANYVTSIGKCAFAIGNVSGFNSQGPSASTLTRVEAHLCETIDVEAFRGNTTIQEIDMPLLESVGNYAFYNCIHLESIPSSIETVGDYAFYTCPIIENLPLALKTVGNYAFYNCERPTTICDSMPLETVGNYGFYNCAHAVWNTFPSTLTSIGNYGFASCSALAITELPSNLESIGQYAFQYCINADFDSFPASITSLSTYALAQANGITSFTVTLPTGMSFPAYCFYNCNALASADLDEFDAIDNNGYQFYNCPALTTVTWNQQNTIETIPQAMFSQCQNLQSMQYPANLKNINASAFSNCTSLDSTTLPDTVVKIDSSAFSGCASLAITDLPESLTTLGASAFSGCTSLQNIRFPENFTGTPSNSVFSGCTGLESVVFLGKPTGLGVASGSSAIFYNCNALTDIYVPWAQDEIANAPWGATNATIHYQAEIYDLAAIRLNASGMTIQNVAGSAKQLIATYNPLVKSAQKGLTWSYPSYVSVDANGLVTMLQNVADGTTFTVTATSTYDSSIYASCAFTAKAQSYSINLNNGQWVNSGTTVDGNTVYKSDAGSYHIANGTSRAQISIIGYTKFVVMIRSYAESSYDYTMAGVLDTTGYSRTTSSGTVVQHTSSRQSTTQYYAATYTGIDGGEHVIEILYAKDSSADSGDDRGYFYIDEANCE